jgi:Zn-dependent alcohol dehydrogenase
LTSLDEQGAECGRIVRRVKALVLSAVARRFDLDDIALASARSREVLIEVQAFGLCRSDLGFASRNSAPTPAVRRHEVAGVAASVSAG